MADFYLLWSDSCSSHLCKCLYNFMVLWTIRTIKILYIHFILIESKSCDSKADGQIPSSARRICHQNCFLREHTILATVQESRDQHWSSWLQGQDIAPRVAQWKVNALSLSIWHSRSYEQNHGDPDNIVQKTQLILYKNMLARKK